MEKPYFNLKLKGKLEIQYDKYHKSIKEFEIEAKDLNQLLHKLSNEVLNMSLKKVQEVLQLVLENQKKRKP